MNITEMLDRLADLQAAPDAIRLQKQAIIDTILTPEIKAALAEVDAEFAEPLRVAEEAATQIELEIREAVLAAGKVDGSYRGQFLTASWVKGHSGSWDDKMLKGFAMIHPEILQAKKPDGEPSVTIKGQVHNGTHRIS
jgi:hypothetical protein